MRTPAPQDPHFERRVRENFERQAVMKLLGARLARVEPGLVEIELPVRPDFSQQDGFVHAGIVTTIIDSAGGYAAYTLMPAASSVLTVEFKVNFMNPARGQRIRAIGRVKKAGRTLTVCELEAIAVDGGKEAPCAGGLQTLICVMPT